MVASREVELPYYKGVGRQQGRGFGAIAQIIGRTAIPFSKKFVVPAGRLIGADMLGFAVPEIADVVSSNKNFKAAAKNVGRQTLKKQLGGGSRKRSAKKVIQFKSKKRNSRLRRDIFTNVATWKWLQKKIRYQPYVAVSGNLGGKVPVVDDVLSSHEQQIYPTTLLYENSVEFEFQTYRKYYVDLRQSYLTLKVKLVKGRGYDTHKSKEAKKEHKNEEQPTEAATNDEEDDTNSVLLLNYVNNTMLSIFSNVEVCINNQQIYNSIGLYAHKSYISNNVKRAISEYKVFCIVKVMTFEANPDDIQDSPLSDPFFSRRLKMLLRCDGLRENWVLIFSHWITISKYES